MCRNPWFCVRPYLLVFFLRGYQHSEREKWRQHSLYNSWTFAFDLKEKVEVKVYQRSYYFLRSRKKVGPKVAYFYCGKAYRDWPLIQDPKIFTVWNPIESKDLRLLGQLLGAVWRSKKVVLILLLRLFPSDQKHSSRNCLKFVDVKRFRSECR